MRIKMKRAAPKDTESDSSPDAASDVKPVKRKGKVALTYEFTCQDCKQEFMKQSAYDTHRASMHDPKRKFVCSECKGGSNSKVPSSGRDSSTHPGFRDVPSRQS